MYLRQACALVSSLVIFCAGQGQPAGNSSITICSWSSLRAAMIRDQIYLDGGLEYYHELNYDPWMVFQTTVSLNLTFGFSLTDNLTDLLTPLLNGASLKDNSYSGYMFTNDFQFYTYGGQLSPSIGASQPPPDHFVFGYNLYSKNSGDDMSQTIGPTRANTTLPSEVTRYITDGAGVSIPSEDLGFYFSGMTNPDKEAYGEGIVQTPSDTLIKVDMSTSVPTWSRTSLSGSVTPRADAQLVWIPVADSGLLIALGGVINPESLFSSSLNASQVAESETVSPSFMTIIDVYDVASGAWYTQNTTSSDHPGQLTGFCAVVTMESSGSTRKSNPSFEIYIYGGYNGLLGNGTVSNRAQPTNDIWVLSVPSFTWTKVYDGNLSQGRQFHSCFTPYPDQMLIIGGVSWEFSCLDSFIKIFNLNTLEWQTGYDPAVYSEYVTPQIVASTIAAAGSIAPNMNPKLAQLFNTPYEKPITVYYPYNTPGSTTKKLEVAVKQALASWFGGLLGIILYLLLSTICLFALVIIRRRMLLQRHGAAPLASTTIEKSRLGRWINNLKVDTEEKQTLMDDEEDTPSKVTVAPDDPKAGPMENLFARIQRSDASRWRMLLGRDKKPLDSSEIYQLRTRQVGDVVYAPVLTNQQGERPSMGSTTASPQNA